MQYIGLTFNMQCSSDLWSCLPSLSAIQPFGEQTIILTLSCQGKHILNTHIDFKRGFKGAELQIRDSIVKVLKRFKSCVEI